MKDWLLEHRRSVLFAFAVLTLAGLVSASRLPVSLFPLIDFPRIAVSLEAGDRPVDRMVVEVTRPVEQALRGVQGVVGLRSTSSRGSAEVSVTLQWGDDMTAATLQVESQINRLLPDLPPGTRFEVRRMDPTIFPVLGLALTSDKRDPVALRDLAYFTLRPVISAAEGVAQVEVLGGREAEYQVLLDPVKLASLGLSMDDIGAALAANNVVVSLGRLEDRYRLFLLLADNRLRTADDIGQTIIKSGPRGTVQLNDIGSVQRGEVPAWSRVTAQGRDAVLVNVRQGRGANTVALVKDVRARLAAEATLLPPDVQLATYYDQSELITAAAASVRDAILIGAALAGLVLLAFFRSMRLTLVVALVLPAVLASTAVLLSMKGMSLNMMTLGGMAAAVGLVVDDAVVMLEHIMRRLQERHLGNAGAPGPLGAAAEMVRPLAGSSLATVVVFAPLSFISGVTGGFFKALALTMAASLIISFAFAMWVVPLLADRFVRLADAEKAEHAGRTLERVRQGYSTALGRLLERPSWVAGCAVVLVIAGVLAYRSVGTGFMPRMDEGGFILDYRAPPGTSLAETDRLLRQIEALIRDTPEVDSYSRRTGVQLGGGLTEANEGDFFIHLRPPPRRDIEAVMADLRGRAEALVPGLTIETAQLMEDLIGDLTAVPQPIEVKLFSADVARLYELGPAVAAALEAIPGVVEVQDGVRIAGDAVEIRIDRVRAALEGLDADAVTRQLQALLEGSIVGQLQDGEKLIGIRVWIPAGLRDRIALLDQLQLRSPDGHQLPLRRIAQVVVTQGAPQVTREDLESMLPVTARLENRDLGSAMREVQKAVAALGLPPQVRVEYGGLYAEQQRSFRDLAAVFVAALLLVTVLLLFLYERWSVVLSILATVMLSVSGVLLGLWATRTELNISAMMGLTMIVGIVTEVAIFYFAEIDLGQPLTHAALLRAGRARLRPIVMTALIAILTLLPLALGIGAGSALQTPLAISIISGLVFGVPLVLLVMPAMFRRLGRVTPA